MEIRPVGAELFRADGQTDKRTDRYDEANTVIPRLTSDPAKEFFG